MNIAKKFSLKVLIGVLFGLGIVFNLHSRNDKLNDLNLMDLNLLASAQAEDTIGANCPSGYLLHFDEVIIVYWVDCQFDPQDCCKET